MSIQSGKFESGQVYFPNDALWLLIWKLSFLLSRIHVTMTRSMDRSGLAHKMSRDLWDQKSLDGLTRFVSMLTFCSAFRLSRHWQTDIPIATRYRLK